MIEFVSYTGEYPTLCHGVLTVKIDGKEYKFGHEPLSYDFCKHCYPDNNLPRFWSSGGSAGFGINENGETDYGIVLRAKGILNSNDGLWLHFDLTPGEYEVRDGSADYTGRLCVIGSGLKEDELKKLFM